MDGTSPPIPSQPPKATALYLPPPPTVIPLRPNLGNWTQHDHHCLRNALARIPSWDIAALAAAIRKPPVEVVWHLSTVHAATLVAQRSFEVALDPLQALLVGFNPVNCSDTGNNATQDIQDEDTSTSGWESDDASDGDDEDRDHERRNQCMYAQESDKPTIAKEEETSTRLARNLDKMLVQLNQERPLSRLNKRKVSVFSRTRITKIMSHHLNNGSPLTVLNDTWLDLHDHLSSFIRTRLVAAYNHAYARMQATHKHGTHIFVDHLTLDDMHSALAVCAATCRPNGIARARADAERTKELVHWWHAEYLPANPEVREEMGKKMERMFRARGIEWRQVRTWRPRQDLLARLDHVFIKTRRQRKWARTRAAVHDENESSSNEEQSTSDDWSESESDEGSGVGLAQFERVQRWLDAAAASEPVKLPDSQGLFHVDALMSLHDNGHEEDEDEEEEDQLDDSASDREDEEHSDSDRDGDELELDSDGLPRSGQRTRRSSTRTPPRSPPPPPHAPFQTPAPLRSISASQFATPATATPGTRRGRPIRFRVGPDVGDNFMDDDEPPSVLRSSRRAKRPLPPDESPSRSRVRASRWEDAGAAMDVDDEGRDQVDEEEEDDGNAARSQSSDREEVDELPQASGSWNVRKRARFG